jgi:hypothetical protein
MGAFKTYGVPMRSRCILLAPCLVLVLACQRSNARPWPIPRSGRTIDPVGSAQPNTAAGTNSGLSRREVSAKAEPASLYARDGAHCKVTPDRFKDTAVGDRVWCNWEDSKTP